MKAKRRVKELKVNPGAKNISDLDFIAEQKRVDVSEISRVEYAKRDANSRPHVDMSQIKAIIQRHLLGSKEKVRTAVQKKSDDDNFFFTQVPGFDDLLENGIPKGSAVVVAGGAGSGKTIFALQILYNRALRGEKCLYMSFEESEERLIKHMEDFGWDARTQIRRGNLLIKRFNPFDITRSVDALLMKAKGELLIDIEPIVFPEGFRPNVIAIDSLTAIDSAFTGKEDSYRIYIEQLFRFLEECRSTSFLITETEQVPKVFSSTGVEEFLADGVFVLYAIKRGNIRENAIEVLKLRGAKHQKKIVAMSIGDQGIEVYPEQEVFGGVD
ncbi:MAG TPA: ATPase domain-containing protein [Candidatus Nanoarchaeia archaeon]|nr:ATPase domain-containing protein [Candidatus Nanoarchaeia archaeon]